MRRIQLHFPHHRVPNNPQPGQPVDRLKYVGPFFATRFERRRILSLEALAALMNRQTRAQNVRFLSTILENPRRRQCLPPAKRFEPPPCPCRYKVRNVNKLAFNAILWYMHQRQLVEAARLPTGRSIQRNRQLDQAFPNTCGIHHRPRQEPQQEQENMQEALVRVLAEKVTVRRQRGQREANQFTMQTMIRIAVPVFRRRAQLAHASTAQIKNAIRNAVRRAKCLILQKNKLYKLRGRLQSDGYHPFRC